MNIAILFAIFSKKKFESLFSHLPESHMKRREIR